MVFLGLPRFGRLFLFLGGVFIRMKGVLSLIVCVLMLFSIACTNTDTVPAVDGDYVVLTVTQADDCATLIDYMNKINGSKSLKSFEISNGMITVINGKKASGNVYWMVFTDDADYSNEQWGSVEIDGVTYYSATLGAESLPIEEGATYVWYAQAF